MVSSRLSHLRAAALAIFLLAAGFLAYRSIAGNTPLTPQAVRTWIVSWGPWAPVIYLLAYSVPIIPLPFSVMAAGAGLAFGAEWGTAVAGLGATLRACATYPLARALGRASLPEKWCLKAEKMGRNLRVSPFKTVLLIRIVPNVPYDVQSGIVALMGVSFFTYLAGTALGVLFPAWICANAGDALTRPSQWGWIALGIALGIGSLSLWQRRHASDGECK